MSSPQLKLIHQGLILVLVPLIFEYFCVGTLAFLHSRAEAARINEIHSKAMIAQCNIVLTDFQTAGGALAAYGLKRNSVFERRFQQIIGEIPAEVAELHRLASAEPGLEQEDVRRVELLSNQAVDLLKTAKQDLDGDSPADSIAPKKPHELLPSILNHLIAETARVRDASRRFDKQYEQVRLTSSNQLYMGLFLLILLNTGLAFALVFFFHKKTVKRLTILADNAVRVSKKQELSQPIGGNDEISYVDRIFHEMAKALAEAEKREAEIQQIKQQFVAMLSHDLRTPLTSMKMLFEMLGEGVYGEVPDRAQQRIRGYGDELDRLIGLINNLLDLEKMEEGMLQLVSAQTAALDVIKRSVRAVEGVALQRRIKVTTSLQDDSLQCYGDMSRLVQVMVNLLSNAIKFAPEDSEIVLSAVSESNGYVKFTVTDNGPGIAADKQALIFDRFQQIDRSDSIDKGGSGLGLAVCKCIVEKHGGQIGVDSTIGKGSTFWFSVPQLLKQQVGLSQKL